MVFYVLKSAKMIPNTMDTIHCDFTAQKIKLKKIPEQNLSKKNKCACNEAIM